MTKSIGILALMFVLITVVIAKEKVKITVKTMPPSVVKTVPQAGNMEVDPLLKEITVTFSKDMMTEKMWSWCSQSPESFPEINKDNIRYLKDKRTCVLPVKLQAGKTYVIWINSRNFKNFKDTENNSAIAYLLVFKTASKAALALRRSAEKSAASAAGEWVLLLDKGKYNESWNNAAAYLKAKITEKQWGRVLQAARMQLGKNLSRKLVSSSYHTSLPGAPDGKYVVIRFKASFEKKSVIETIVPMLDKDGKWRVSGYYIK